MNLLVIIGDRTPLDLVLRKEGIANWIVTVIGNELPYPSGRESLDRLPTMDLEPFSAILLVNVPMLTRHSAMSLAKVLIGRQFHGKLLVFAEADKPGVPSEMRINLRKVGVRDDQFVATIADAIHELKR